MARSVEPDEAMTSTCWPTEYCRAWGVSMVMDSPPDEVSLLHNEATAHPSQLHEPSVRSVSVESVTCVMVPECVT